MELTAKSIAAGFLISMVSYCNLVCGDRYIGAILFSFGLIIICKYGLKLFTGMAGYKHTKDFASVIGLNCLTAYNIGLIASFNSAAATKAIDICNSKIEHSSIYLIFSAIMCGALIFLAVDYYKKNNSLIGILFAIPIFVLCGFDHTVADIFYFGVAGRILPLKIIVIVLGNIIGSKATYYLIRGE